MYQVHAVENNLFPSYYIYCTRQENVSILATVASYVASYVYVAIHNYFLKSTCTGVEVYGEA